MKNYEIICLVSADLSTEEIQKIQETITSLVQADGGIIIEARGLAKKTAFFAEKRKEVISLCWEFQLKPASLENLDKKLKDEKQIVRYFLMLKPKIKEAPKQRMREFKKPLAEINLSPLAGPEPKVKVEIAEIEKKLEEILGKTDAPPIS